MIEIKCDFCGKKVKKFLKDILRSKNHFCSLNCAYKWREGENSSLYDVHLFGKDNPNYGNHKLAGKNNPNWKGGISSENNRLRVTSEYKNWRYKVFKKDNYSCIKCSKKGVYLIAHHQYSFSKYHKLRFEVSNGVTLCKKCHNKFHKIFGRKNNNPIQIMKFLLID